ncbi:hypothetical protein AB0B50_43070 [Streptomyces sp. NPDC041068]|uniref:hypothetical protein n=1 Tax=Streptomyces sp. NPDC041068 TaxID=3155130 RepID=UPI0033FF9F20
MGGSAKRTRRRAAGPALRYEHVPGARTSGRSGKRSSKRSGRLRIRLRSVGFACMVVACLTVGSAALFLGPLRWAGEMWHALAPDWPGEGYGFAATAGLLLPVAGALAIAPLTRANWRKDKVRSALWTAAALPGAGAALLIASIAMQTIKPKRSHRHGTCSTTGEYCWISSNYPYVWLVGLAAPLLAAAALLGLYDRYADRRDARLTPPATTEPWDRPRPDRPTCT